MEGQPSQGYKSEEHLSHIDLAVTEAVADSFEQLDLGVHALRVAVRNTPGVVGQNRFAPAAERASPLQERGIACRLGLKDHAVQDGCGFVSIGGTVNVSQLLLDPIKWATFL